MLSLIVKPGVADSTRVEWRPPPAPRHDQALVRTLELGVCGTDREIHAGLVGAPPPGREDLVLGHEVLGRVERAAPGFQHGELVTATVRRSCEACENCLSGNTDSCMTGKMPERGIHRADGFGSELFVEQLENLVAIPQQLGRLGVLTEPMTICERGVRHALAVGERQAWSPRRAVVLGAGAIGILATLLLRIRGLAVWTMSRGSASSEKANLVRASGADYVSLGEVSARAATREIAADLLIEATGDAGVVSQILASTNRNGVICLLGVDPRPRSMAIDARVLGEEFVVGNRALLGSVNAARQDWPRAVEGLVSIEARFPGLLDAIVWRRLTPDRFSDALASGGVKTTIVFSTG